MKKIIISVVVTLIILGFGTFVYLQLAPEQITIPEKLTKENAEKQLTTYMPTWLPGTYKIDKDSYSREEGQVFTFSVTDENRNRLFFSQQPIPKNFDFDRFYKTKVVEPVKLENVPYESIYARSLFGNGIILSIKTQDTWIMMTTTAPIDQVMAQKIVQEMKRY